MGVEHELLTHDIAIPITPVVAKQSTRRLLRVLLLSASCVIDNKIEDTMNRLDHFAFLTGGIDVAIVFLLHSPPAFVSAKSLTCSDHVQTAGSVDGIHAYAKLQVELKTRKNGTSIPILLLASLDGLSALLSKHAQSLSRPLPKIAATSVVNSIELLPVCITGRPMTHFGRSLISDLFPSLKHLADAAERSRVVQRTTSANYPLDSLTSLDDLMQTSSDEEGKFAMLREQLGAEVVNGMIDFWTDGWVAG